MKAIFFGSPEFACPSLEALAEIAEVCAVITQPDRPAGRGLLTKAPAVKTLATQRGWKVLQPEKIRDGKLARQITEMKIDVAVVVAYGRILPQEILSAAQHGCVNVHASLLPRWRGAAPIQHAILAGDAETGVSLMQLDAGMDTGAVFSEIRTSIAATDTAGELTQRLTTLGAQLLKRDLPAIVSGSLHARPQDNALATLAPKISSPSAIIDWSLSAREIERLVRAMNPQPVAHTSLDGRGIKIFGASVISAPSSVQLPGTIEAIDSRGIVVTTGAGALAVQELQQSGKNRLQAKEFALGAGLAVGMRFVTEDVHEDLHQDGR